MKKRRYIPDLIEAMADCDANYIRLMKLFCWDMSEEKVAFGISGACDSRTGVSATGVSATGVSATGVSATGVSGTSISATGVSGTTEDGTLIEIEVATRCPYTTMLNLRVTNEEYKPWIKWPSMEVRVYHDVKSAEVVSFERHRRIKYRYDYPNARMYAPDEKAQINKYLGELLSFCINHGHSLVAIADVSSKQAGFDSEN